MKLAKQGVSVVLISRTKSKLEATAKECEDQNADIDTKVVVCDFSNFDEKARNTVKKAVANLDIGLLINNVGVSYTFPKYFSEISEEEVGQLIEMNVNSTTWMTHMILPGMLERKRGSIVNIASAAGTITSPLLAQYSAAKSYIIMFSRGLNAECKGKGVTVSCQVPYYVATKLAKMRKAMMVPEPKEYVDMAVRWIGYSDDVTTSPFWMHAVQGWALTLLPQSIVDSQILGMHLGIRKRGFKKLEQKKE